MMPFDPESVADTEIDYQWSKQNSWVKLGDFLVAIGVPVKISKAVARLTGSNRWPKADAWRQQKTAQEIVPVFKRAVSAV